MSTEWDIGTVFRMSKTKNKVEGRLYLRLTLLLSHSLTPLTLTEITYICSGPQILWMRYVACQQYSLTKPPSSPVVAGG
jgi:hypothetical protein